MRGAPISAAIPESSISGHRAARKLTALIERRGKPGMIVSDNGTELTSNAIQRGVRREQGRMALHRARKADAELFVERLNGRMRDQFLNKTRFRNVPHVRDLISAWVTDHNAAQSH